MRRAAARQRRSPGGPTGFGSSRGSFFSILIRWKRQTRMISSGGVGSVDGDEQPAVHDLGQGGDLGEACAPQRVLPLGQGRSRAVAAGAEPPIPLGEELAQRRLLGQRVPPRGESRLDSPQRTPTHPGPPSETRAPRTAQRSPGWSVRTATAFDGEYRVMVARQRIDSGYLQHKPGPGRGRRRGRGADGCAGTAPGPAIQYITPS